MDQPSGEYVGGQKQASVIIFNECPKVVDRFRQKIRSKAADCVKHYGRGEFFVPAGTSSLNDKTWIILSEIYPISPTTIQNDREYTRLREVTLPSKLMDKIIDCLFKHHSDDVPEMYEHLIRPKVDDWKQQLAQKFNA